MQTFLIGDVAFEIPDFLDTRIEEEDGTLVAYLPESDYANLRFTLSTIWRDGELSVGAGDRFIRRTAAKENCDLRETDGKVWFTYAKPATEGSPGSIMTFWEVGLGAHFMVISCFIDSAVGDPVMKQQVLDSVPDSIRSLRRVDASAPNQTMQPTVDRRTASPFDD